MEKKSVRKARKLLEKGFDGGKIKLILSRKSDLFVLDFCRLEQCLFVSRLLDIHTMFYDPAQRRLLKG